LVLEELHRGQRSGACSGPGGPCGEEVAEGDRCVEDRDEVDEDVGDGLEEMGCSTMGSEGWCWSAALAPPHLSCWSMGVPPRSSWIMVMEGEHSNSNSKKGFLEQR
jgi:hypothetical protein